MVTKVILNAIVPLGAPLPQMPGQPEGPPQYHAYTATFTPQNFPADGKVPGDYVHLPPGTTLNAFVSADTAKALKLGGEYVLTLSPVGT